MLQRSIMLSLSINQDKILFIIAAKVTISEKHINCHSVHLTVL